MVRPATPWTQVYLEDCFKTFARIPSGSIDLVLCDPPYGTTQCKWDAVIPLEPMWKELKRVAKVNLAIVLMSGQPFTSVLVTSNLREYRYDWIWVKSKITGVLNARRMPVRKHERLSVFYKQQPTYNPQGLKPYGKLAGQGAANSNNYGARSSSDYVQEWTNWPRDVLEIASTDTRAGHPTQKPIELMRYFVNTYSNPGDVVLDFAMGSGTTGVACRQLRRRFIGCDTDAGYFAMAQNRIRGASFE